MKFKKSLLIICLIVCLFAIASVSATDTDDSAISSEDTGEIELSHEIESADDNLGTGEEQKVTQTDNEEKTGATDDGTFNALDSKIRSASSGDTVYLENNYSCEDSWTMNTGIYIDKSNLVIDGQGHTIDAKQKTRIFDVYYAENVTIKNIKFINAKYETTAGAIYWSYSANGSVSGCSFVNCAAERGGGGAIQWHYSDGCVVSGCSFVNCAAEYDRGGAIQWYESDNGSVSGCSFVNCAAELGFGGAIHWEIGSANGNISDCVFINNTDSNGKAIYINGFASLDRNWFGNTAENYETSPNAYIYGAGLGNWLFLNATVAPNPISIAETADIIFKLYLYNGSITDYTSLAKVDLTMNSNGNLDKNIAGLDEKVAFTPTSPGTGSVTATIGDVAYTTTLTVTDGTTFWDLNKTINGNTNDTITLDKDYAYNPVSDSAFTEGIVINRPVTINGNGYAINANGKARIFQITGNDVVLKNITFINGHTTDYGGAVYFSQSGRIINCNFDNNSASSHGGAIRFTSTGNVTNCNFTNNSAQYGGAIRLGLGNVTNCNFINNTATNYGGALLVAFGTVSKCNFINNTAENGGAIRFNDGGAVTNCNFTGNNATMGSAIYFYSTSANKNVSNSIFLNNRANAEALEVTKNDNNIIITFTGQNNLLNAIFSRNDAKVTFTNVTYWGKNGLATISGTISGLNGEAGQNITVIMVVNDILILNTTEVTDENGQIVLDAVAGNCTITALHIEDSYYTYAETTETFNITGNETTLKLNVYGHTVTATVSPDIAIGNVTLTLSNESGIVRKVQRALSDGVAELDITGLIGDYNITATYSGNIYCYPAIGTLSISDEVPFNVSDIIISFGEVANVVVVVPEAISGQNISITVNGTSKNATVKDGKADAGFTDLLVGEYLIAVDYWGDGYHCANSTTVNLTVNKAKTQLTADAITTTYNINKDLVITLKDVNGNALGGVGVTVDLNGAKTYVTDANGQIRVSTKGLTPKTYTAKITFNGDDKYINSNKDVKVTVKKATPKLTAKKKTFKTSVKTKKYTIVLKDNTGKAIKKAKVTLKVKGKTYKATTNSKGKATFKIKNLNKKGTFKATITYKGNKYYNKATKKAKIKVIVAFKTVSKGSKDKATVKEIQQALKNNGYYLTYDGHYLKIDGIYHGCTERSVKEFQHDKGLKVTGKVDEKTAKKLGII